ncbi:chitin synthase [Histoplasma capsulatum G186AR]|uniref:chitin synthase n=2 Tax=Ajellomyces capsulatus TaxID=5037 RepID=C0NSP8_AJECG|nr:chitin synthase [Histoplasma capsulatum G186AR]EEH05914.1 chitin synthase [Histoplasma capsulatum G186AR]KAG5299919.1 chitin synthase [Histoplasma capsulatum]QSS67452.1 chitin synthase [Histoplasma capsulatum G186AR]
MALHSLTGTGSVPAHAQSSLPSLPAHLQSDTHLTAHLASRFHVSLPTARLSSQGLICLNTYTSSTRGPDGQREGSAMGEADDLARRAWARLGGRGENQAVIFLGETGSGKTTVRSHLLSSFLSLSSTPLSAKLSLAAFVFDTLTTTKSVTTPTASKAGLFFELQYDASSTLNPTLIGGKLLDHRLERSRIASVPTGERSFHVLYYLLAGTSAAEKAHLGLDSSVDIRTGGNTGNHSSGTISHKRWRYLGHPTQLKVGINDTEGFQQFKNALRKLEFPRSEIAEICQILACILHIGQLEFTTGQSTTTGPEESGGYSHEGGETVTIVKNKDALAIIAAFLGLSVDDLETSLGYKTKTIHRERVTVMLDPKGARSNADDLARTLYALLVAYVIENINQRVCAAEDAVANTISIIDFPGFSQTSATGSTLDQLLNNAATESLYNYCLRNFFDHKAEILEAEEVSVPPTSYFDNSDAVKALLKQGNGILTILDDQTKRGRSDMQLLESLRKRFANKNPAISVGSSTATLPGSNFASKNEAATFTVRHFAGEVDYPVQGLVEENSDLVSGDLMNLITSSRSAFVRDLFGQEALQTIRHPKEKSAIMQAQVSSKPLRMPSMARRKMDRPPRLTARATQADKDIDDDTGASLTSVPGSKKRKQGDSTNGPGQSAAAQFLVSLDNINKSLAADNVNSYFVFCLKPNDRRIANQFDSKCVRSQVQTFGIAEISQRLRNADFSVFLPFSEFLGLSDAESIIVGSEQEKCQLVVDEKRWPGNEARVGSTGVFLSERCWADIARVGERVLPSYSGDGTDDDKDGLLGVGQKAPYGDSKVRLLNSPDVSPLPGSYIYGDETKQPFYGVRDIDGRSDAGASAFNSGDMFKNLETREQMAEKGNEKKMEEVDDVVVSGSRKRWLAIVYLLTFYIPDFTIKLIGRMKRKDVRIAWREKFAINLLIWFSCALAVFFIIGFPQLICPKQYVFSPDELSSRDGKKNDAYIAIRGEVFDLGAFIPSHYPKIVPRKSLEKYAGLDATKLFPVQVSALCDGVDGQVDPSVPLDFRSTNRTGSVKVSRDDDPNAQYHDFRAFTDDYRPDWYWNQMRMLRANYKKGYVGYSPQYLKTLVDKDQAIAVLDGYVYDLTNYVIGGRRPRPPPGQQAPKDVNVNFMDPLVVNLFQQRPGQDITEDFNRLPLGKREQAMRTCLANLFQVGKLDTRSSAQCQFAQYFILAISLLLVTIIGFKFFAALQFGKKNLPENLDKFIICQVPAYTEDEESLRRAIDSMARMRYDDKRKLLVVICDGMIIGQGNDRPTPRIVLDILGVSDTVDPEPLSFESLGEGMKQHNMGKVYSGLYEVQGHIVPFLVVVKVGKPSEVSRPGNRGKRDSQMLLMRFLNRIHYNHPMSPLELEIHHQIRNIIGVNPTFYEFILQVDADTMVAPDSATRMVASFLQDTRIIGLCGETGLNNAKSSIITMIQVYEYYISHNLTKAFESLFGSVTCLPGCFTMYRIRAADTGKPLFVSREVVEAYAEIRVDTLHMKNLLHLGEDRYLTTLLLKHHPKYKTKFLFNAHAWTIAPDSWAVFMSQRRRWINSTVHNLIELIPLQQLCGFCCFSMRFVVFVDLLSTVIQPVTVAYVIYLIVLIAINPSLIPITAFILLGAIYGLQAIIFIVRRKWEMVGWMIIYILAMPVFSLGLPLYSFWHMDDFTWGNTRIVTGEKGRKVVISDEGKFDPASIPKKKWEEYQIELWEAQTQQDDRSEVSGISYGTRSYHPPASEYGFAASRPVSQVELNRFAGSRMSLSPSEMLGTGPDMEMVDLTGLPSDDSLLAEIRDILRTADLMTVTKKSVKLELEQRFNINLDAKRQYINSATEAVLSGQL